MKNINVYCLVSKSYLRKINLRKIIKDYVKLLHKVFFLKSFFQNRLVTRFGVTIHQLKG